MKPHPIRPQLEADYLHRRPRLPLGGRSFVSHLAWPLLSTMETLVLQDSPMAEYLEGMAF